MQSAETVKQTVKGVLKIFCSGRAVKLPTVNAHRKLWKKVHINYYNLYEYIILIYVPDSRRKNTKVIVHCKSKT